MLRVLVVDDAPVIRSSIAKSVERFSDNVVVSGEAGHGAEALDWLDRHFADLCITDVRMPVMDGLELIQEIRGKYPWMISMVVSSYDEFDYARQSIELDAIDYILKPIDQSKLNGALARSVEKLQSNRMRQAGELFIQRLPHHRAMTEAWTEAIRSLRTESMPVLIVETLELLKSWVGDRYYLLNALSMCWLRTIVEELHRMKLSIDLDEGVDIGLGGKTLAQSDLRFYYSLCSVRRLEEGANLLLQSMLQAKDGLGTKWIEEAKRFIGERCSEKLSIQEVADFAGVSRSHLANLFKQQTGYTVNQYMVEVRMRKARDLLLHTSLRSYEIADKVGYEDPIYFSQLFKKHYGLAPIEYKRRLEN